MKKLILVCGLILMSIAACTDFSNPLSSEPFDEVGSGNSERGSGNSERG